MDFCVDGSGKQDVLVCCLSSCFFHAVLVLVPAQVAITSLLAYFFDDVVLVRDPDHVPTVNVSDAARLSKTHAACKALRVV